MLLKISCSGFPKIILDAFAMDQAIKPLVIPVFIPHSGCPHQCAFCNQTIITSQKASLPDKTALHQTITRYLQYKGRRKSVELAFFGGNFLGLDDEAIIRLLDWIQPYIRMEKIDGIRFSTRPDTITREKLDLIRSYPVSAVELGVQSMNDKVLLKSKRGHTSADTREAIHLLKGYPFKIGVQIMVGLPHDHDASLFESTGKLAELAPDFARIYPLMVLKGSLMEKWYRKGRYQPLRLKEAIVLVKGMYRILKAENIDVIRMGLQASELMEDKSMVIAGPWHPAFGHLVLSSLFYDRVCKKMDHCPGLSTPGKVFIEVHPRSESRLRGNKNINLKKLGLRYPGVEFVILKDKTILPDLLKIRR